MNYNSHYYQSLTRIHGLLSEKSNWTQLVHARLPDGKPTNWWNYKATQFSLYGAIHRCANLPIEFDNIACVIQKCINEYSDDNLNIISFNEAKDHGDIIAVLIMAITKTKTINQVNGVPVTKRMQISFDHDKTSISSNEHAYYLGYTRGVNEFSRKQEKELGFF